MIQRRDGASLAPESVGVLCFEALDRDDTIDPPVTGLPHFPHAASAQGTDDLVGAETGAWSQSQTQRIIWAESPPPVRCARFGNVRKPREPDAARGPARFTLLTDLFGNGAPGGALERLVPALLRPSGLTR